MELIARVVRLPLQVLVQAVMSRLPRHSSLVVFGAPREHFADNPAYLFLQLSQTAPSLRCVWITGSETLVQELRARGFAAELRWSARGMWACVRADWFVFGTFVSDINDWLYHGARLFNLWHGIPLKAIGLDVKTGRSRWMNPDHRIRSLVSALARRDERRSPDVLLSTSRFISERCFSSAFDVAAESCLDVGYPRTDHFFSLPNAPPNELLVSDISVWERLRASSLVVGYFPTWRDDDSPFMRRSGLSLDRLARAVSAAGGLLVFKPHYLAREPIAQSDDLIVLDAHDNLNAYLHLCSVLITDYSSVAFDFMLLNRPILYYVPDFEEYGKARGLYFRPDEMMPGPLLRSPEELYRSVESLESGQPADGRVSEVRSLVWGSYAGDACARIAEFLEQHVS